MQLLTFELTSEKGTYIVCTAQHSGSTKKNTGICSLVTSGWSAPFAAAMSAGSLAHSSQSEYQNTIRLAHVLFLCSK